MRIDLLLLDVDGVLVQYQRAQRVLHLAQALQVPTQAVQAALYDSGRKRHMTMARWMARPIWRSWESFWARLSKWLHGPRRDGPPAILRRPCCNDCRPCSCQSRC